MSGILDLHAETQASSSMPRLSHNALDWSTHIDEWPLEDVVRAGVEHWNARCEADWDYAYLKEIEAVYLPHKKFKSKATSRRYGFHFGKFEKWCADSGIRALPCGVGVVAKYLDWEFRENLMGISGLRGRKASIAYAHRRDGYPDPTEHEVIERVLNAAKKQPSKEEVN
jgi:hypothetical protein